MLTITPNGSQPSAKGPADYFTGTVRVDSPFKGTDAARVTGAVVTFEPGRVPRGTPIPWGRH